MDFSGFRHLSIDKRIEKIAEYANLNQEEINYLSSNNDCHLGSSIGPFAIAYNFKVNDIEYVVPLDIEEKTVDAAASRIGKLNPKITAEYTPGTTQGILTIENPKIKNLKDYEKEILEIANKNHKYTKAESIEIRNYSNDLILLLNVDTGESQGFNTINKMLIEISDYIEKKTKGTVINAINTNYTRKSVKAKLEIEKEKLARSGYSGEEIARMILKLQNQADNFPKRTITHDKGIANIVSAIARATGNDDRAIFASWNYRFYENNFAPLSSWKDNGNSIIGKAEFTVPIGVLGGEIKKTKKSQIAFKILEASKKDFKTKDLAEVISASALLENLSSLQEIVSKNIVHGF